MKRLHFRLLAMLTVVIVAFPLTEKPQTATVTPAVDRTDTAVCTSVLEPALNTGLQTTIPGPLVFTVEPHTAAKFLWDSFFHTPAVRLDGGFRLATETLDTIRPGILGLPEDSASAPPRNSVLALAEVVDVTVNDNFFAPETVQIAPGDVVRWTFIGRNHTVTSGTCCKADSVFCSPNDTNCDFNPPSNPGTVYSHQFNTAGTFPYFCNVHGARMIGRVIVESAVTPTPTPTPTPEPGTVQFSALSYSPGEGVGSAQIIVNRTNNSSAATVDYATSDTAALNECNLFNGTASSRCDYATSIGTLRFASGESSKTIFIPIVNDAYAEGNETFSITLSNPTGTTLGSSMSANIEIQDNEMVNGVNPIDLVDFFIRQQYIDFLGREPDPAGLAGWQNVLNNCGITVAPPCDRIEVSAGFFRSEEFQSRGYFIYRFYSAVGRIPLSNEFFPDFAKVSGFLTADQLEANKVAYVNEVMARTEFQNKYSSTFNDPTAYVDALLQTVGLPNHPSKAGWIATLNSNNNSQTRAQVLRQLVESSEVYNKYYNEAFVIMQYFGYLRRTADASYLNWINTMNQTGGDYRIMINGFMNSSEYRRRFGP